MLPENEEPEYFDMRDHCNESMWHLNMWLQRSWLGKFSMYLGWWGLFIVQESTEICNEHKLERKTID